MRDNLGILIPVILDVSGSLTRRLSHYAALSVHDWASEILGTFIDKEAARLVVAVALCGTALWLMVLLIWLVWQQLWALIRCDSALMWVCFRGVGLYLWIGNIDEQAAWAFVHVGLPLLLVLICIRWYRRGPLEGVSELLLVARRAVLRVFQLIVWCTVCVFVSAILWPASPAGHEESGTKFDHALEGMTVTVSTNALRPLRISSN